MATVTHTGTLPDSSNKADFYAIIDNATVTGIVNADCAAGMALADSKLAQITTAGKVSGTSLTGLASIPSGAGVIPAANLTSVAQKGANSDITSLSGMTTPLSVAQGGTGATTAAAARTALGIKAVVQGGAYSAGATNRNANTYGDLDSMTCDVVVPDNTTILVTFSCNYSMSDSGSSEKPAWFAINIAGTDEYEGIVSPNQAADDTGGAKDSFSCCMRKAIASAATVTVKIRYKTGNGSATCYVTQRNLNVVCFA